MSHDRTTILILAANPKGTDRLRLDEEMREIQEGLERSRHRDRFEIISRWAVRPDDLRRVLLDYKPQIVHFSGHGMGEPGLMLENAIGESHLVSSQALAGLFKFFQANVECVVLNACYSELQAEAISQHIQYIIGMNQGISDRAALAFSIGFYDALIAGRSYVEAYEMGCNAIDLKNIPGVLTPQIRVKQPFSHQTKPISPPLDNPKLDRIDPSPPTAPSPQALYQQASELYQAGRWQDVVRLTEQIKARDANYPGVRELERAAQREHKLVVFYDRALQSESCRELQTALKQFEEVYQLRKGYRDTETRIARLKAQLRSKSHSAQSKFLLLWLTLAWAFSWGLIGGLAYLWLIHERSSNDNLILLGAVCGLVGGVFSNLVRQLIIVRIKSLDLKQIALWAGLCAGIWMLVGFLFNSASVDIPSTAFVAAFFSFAANIFLQLFQAKPRR